MPENCENDRVIDTEESDQQRYVGTCKWFNVLKGFGFIVCGDFEEDFFVHQTEINMDGFRSLDEGEKVSFYIRVRKGGKGREAYQVGPADPDQVLEGSSIHPLGKKKNNRIRCFKCGRFGHHFAEKCKRVPGTLKVCYKCGVEGHLHTACPKGKDNASPSEAQNIVNGKTDSF